MLTTAFRKQRPVVKEHVFIEAIVCILSSLVAAMDEDPELHFPFAHFIQSIRVVAAFRSTKAFGGLAVG
jgi:hypothetical protein